MAVSQETIKELAALTLKAEEERCEIPQLKLRYPDLTEEEGYAGEKLRLEMALKKGHKTVGMKLGNTSMAKINQVRQTMMLEGSELSTDPAFGFLLEYMDLGNAQELIKNQLIHPKIETELAFVTKKELYGPYIYTPDVMEAVDYVSPAFEIIDSRYQDFKIGGAPDALMDNVSSARFKLGTEKMDPKKLDLINMGVRTKRNGIYTGFGAGGAVMGHPARAVAKMVRLMYEKMDMPLPAGSVVLSGAIIPSMFLREGDEIRSEFAGLGSVSLRVR